MVGTLLSARSRSHSLSNLGRHWVGVKVGMLESFQRGEAFCRVEHQQLVEEVGIQRRHSAVRRSSVHSLFVHGPINNPTMARWPTPVLLLPFKTGKLVPAWKVDLVGRAAHAEDGVELLGIRLAREDRLAMVHFTEYASG